MRYQLLRLPGKAGRFALLVAVPMLCSCAKDQRPPLYPVQGKVFCQGKPAAGAMLFFHPGEGGANPAGMLPHGVVEADGSFRVGTYEEQDGAQAGQYRVTVRWTSKAKSSDDDERSLLPSRYLNPGTSGLRAEVRNEPTELQFQLTR